jgi:DNA-binding MarR family transcriptional regulator
MQQNDQFAVELRTLLSRLTKKLRSKTYMNDPLSMTEWSTVALLDEHKELMPSELAAMEKITTQSMSQILNHLQELDYISRKISTTDKRKSIISLTKTGRDALYKGRAERNEWLNRALHEACTAKEQDLLRRALVPLAKLVAFE